MNGVIINLQRHARAELSVDRTSYYYECANPAGAAYQGMLTSPFVEVRRNAVKDCIPYMAMGQWVPKVPGDAVSAYTVVETIVPMWIELAFNDSSLADKLFRDAIKEKRDAEARGDRALANEIEVRIQELDKARIKVPQKRVP